MVGQGLVPDLLPQVPDAAERLVGQRISIDGSWFLVVGVFESLQSGETAERAESAVHLPLSTFQQAFRQGERIRWFALSGEPDASAAARRCLLGVDEAERGPLARGVPARHGTEWHAVVSAWRTSACAAGGDVISADAAMNVA